MMEWGYEISLVQLCPIAEVEPVSIKNIIKDMLTTMLLKLLIRNENVANEREGSDIL
jgi:hypothetical protein